jgi:hypothetical protein
MHNAEPLENSRQSFQHFTATHLAAVLRKCVKTACRNREGLSRQSFADSVSAASIIYLVSESQLSTSWVIWQVVSAAKVRDERHEN